MAISSQLQNSTTASKRPRLLTLLKVIASLALIVFIVSRADLSKVFEAIGSANYLFIALAVVLQITGPLILATRWKGLLRAQGVHAPLPRLFNSCIVACFFRQFLPSTIGGDAIRAYDSWKCGASKSVAVATLVVDRMLGLVALITFAVCGLLFADELTQKYPIIYLFLAIGGAALVVGIWAIFTPAAWLISVLNRLSMLLPKVLIRPLRKIAEAIIAYRGRHGALAISLALSFLLQINVVFFYYFIGRAMGFEIAPIHYFVIIPLAIFVMMIPISINGIGVREAIFVLLFGAYAIEPAHAVAFAWVEYGIFLLFGIIGGIVYAVRRPADRLAHAPLTSQAQGSAG